MSQTSCKQTWSQRDCNRFRSKSRAVMEHVRKIGHHEGAMENALWKALDARQEITQSEAINMVNSAENVWGDLNAYIANLAEAIPDSKFKRIVSHINASEALLKEMRKIVLGENKK
ncbi:Uncharacterised protein [uncultured archaeon]|nr:Uncharacterised protein [uncultured archaeon]